MKITITNDRAHYLANYVVGAALEHGDICIMEIVHECLDLTEELTEADEDFICVIYMATWSAIHALELPDSKVESIRAGLEAAVGERDTVIDTLSLQQQMECMETVKIVVK